MKGNKPIFLWKVFSLSLSSSPTSSNELYTCTQNEKGKLENCVVYLLQCETMLLFIFQAFRVLMGIYEMLTCQKKKEEKKVTKWKVWKSCCGMSFLKKWEESSLWTSQINNKVVVVEVVLQRQTNSKEKVLLLFLFLIAFNEHFQVALLHSDDSPS